MRVSITAHPFLDIIDTLAEEMLCMGLLCFIQDKKNTGLWCWRTNLKNCSMFFRYGRHNSSNKSSSGHDTAVVTMMR